MNQFNTKLDLAKRQQKRTYIAFGILVLTGLLAVITLVVISRGTRIELLPVEIRSTAHIQVTNGIALSLGSTIYSISSKPQIRVTAPGFQPARETIDPTHLGSVYPVRLSELPSHIVIHISNKRNDLSKTHWQIDGKEVALGPELDIEIKAGDHTITADNHFYQVKEIRLHSQRGEQKKLTVNLEPITGTIHISSTPKGASVSIDKMDGGNTPLQLPLSGGHHFIQVTAEDFIESVEEITISRDTPELHRNYQLKRRKANISFDLVPTGGTLLGDGIILEGPLSLDATVPHTFTYKKEGYYPQTKKLTFRPEEERRLSFHLQQEKGKILISSTPSASIYIGEKEYGASPITLTLPAVAQKITFRKNGFRERTKTITPKGSTAQNISVTLLTEYQARLQEAPRKFTNQAGIQLKLFLAQETFVMGAPRSEKGQRANEFQRKISLGKPFYASVYEITNSQFAQFNQKKSPGPGNAPVTSVSWQEAAAFCNWLSKTENLQPFYYSTRGKITGFNSQADGYRLLSEAEWEWLARKAGKKQQTIFSWGNERSIPSKAANVADESTKGQVRYYIPNFNDGYPDVAPVGSLNIEPSGLYDQAGNVSEWVHDVYSIVPVSNLTSEDNPLGQPQGPSHVIKGANWRSGTITTLRPAFREGLATGQDDVGFRIARYLYGRENEKTQ